jgi:hypothetical protein
MWQMVSTPYPCVIIEELCAVEGKLGFGLGLRALLDFSSCHNLIHILDNQALESSNSNFIFIIAHCRCFGSCQCRFVFCSTMLENNF